MRVRGVEGSGGGGRAVADRATAGLARILIRVFFRTMEVAGHDHVPRSGPLVEVANHQNGLVDGLVLIAASRRYPRFLGKSTLWRIPPLRPFLALAGVVPVYRSADTAGVLSDEDRSAQNRSALARSRDLLAAGGTIGVFPEGISHDLASLQELRTGAARLALGAAAGGVTDVAVLPVGIVYDDKARFRSRVLVRFGPARAVDDLVPAYRDDPHTAVADLTATIAADLRAVGPDYESVEAAGHWARLAALALDADPPLADPPLADPPLADPPLADPPLADPPIADPSLEDRERLARLLATAATDPANAGRLAAVERRLARYDAGLRRAGLDDGGLRSATRAGLTPPAPRRLLGPLPDLVTLPLAGVGVAVHALPYAVIRVLGTLPSNRGMRATVKLLGSFGLYNVTYVALGLLVGRRRGWRVGLLTAVGAPLSGWVALRTLEDAEELGLSQRAVAAVAGQRGVAARLGAQRTSLGAAIRDLLPPGT